MRSVEEVSYVANLNKLMDCLCAEIPVPKEPAFLSWRDSDEISYAWFASNHKPWVKDIHIQVRFCPHSGRNFCVERHNVEVLGMPHHGSGELLAAHPL